jgi:hypothetical protein
MTPSGSFLAGSYTLDRIKGSDVEPLLFSEDVIASILELDRVSKLIKQYYVGE